MYKEVIIRTDLQGGKMYDGLFCMDEMEAYRGYIARIVGSEDGYFYIEIEADGGIRSGFLWSDNMFEENSESIMSAIRDQSGDEVREGGLPLSYLMKG